MCLFRLGFPHAAKQQFRGLLVKKRALLELNAKEKWAVFWRSCAEEELRLPPAHSQGPGSRASALVAGSPLLVPGGCCIPVSDLFARPELRPWEAQCFPVLAGFFAVVPWVLTRL